MRLRLQGAKLNKAKKGELRCSPPTGYVYDPQGQLIIDPDEGVVAAIQLAFQQFRALGTAFGVMRYFCVNQIPFPRRRWRPGHIGTLHWGPANLSPSGSRSPTEGFPPAAPSHRITALLHNPTYTGTYVYGRRRSLNVIEDGQIKKVIFQQLPQEEWNLSSTMLTRLTLVGMSICLIVRDSDIIAQNPSLMNVQAHQELARLSSKV